MISERIAARASGIDFPLMRIFFISTARGMPMSDTTNASAT